MKVPLTEEILNIIIATQFYKQFAHADSIAKKESVDLYKATKEYYENLPLPNELNTSKACFEAILHYPMGKTINTQAKDLPKNFNFGY